MRWKKPEPRPATYWKPWFAWRPVVIENTGEKVWLEWIWRHVELHGSFGGAVKFQRYRSDVHWGGANLEYRDRNDPAIPY